MSPFKVIVLTLTMLSLPVVANNAIYLTLSNQIARSNQLEVLSNNVANSKTTGYEQDRVLFNSLNHQETNKKSNSYVHTGGVYRPELQGSLKTTGRALDVAVVGKGYFKVITPRGPRYTLDGHFLINSQNILVNSNGYPIANFDDQEIVIPDDLSTIEIVEDGTIYGDVEEIERIGVFQFPDNFILAKEGASLYYTTEIPEINDDYSVVSGALRASNVNLAGSMSELVELQRSYGITSSLMNELGQLERNAVEKIGKTN